MEHKLEAADLAALEAIAPGRVFTGGQISEDYGHDELGDVAHMPEALVKVRSTEEVARILEYADRRLIPVVVRGSGTGLVGASVAVRGGIMLETTGMNRILELDEENLTVTVQPGVLLMDLAEFGFDIEYREVPRGGAGEEEENTILTDFYLVRPFTEGELRLLIDGLLFSRHLPHRQCLSLIHI